MEVPIFDQGQARRSPARSEFNRALERHAALLIEIQNDARAATARLKQSRTRVEMYRDNVLPTRDEVLKQTQLQHNAMQIGVFQLLEAKREQLEAQRKYIQALAEYWTARTQITRIHAGAGIVERGPAFIPTDVSSSTLIMR